MYAHYKDALIYEKYTIHDVTNTRNRNYTFVIYMLHTKFPHFRTYQGINIINTQYIHKYTDNKLKLN